MRPVISVLILSFALVSCVTEGDPIVYAYKPNTTNAQKSEDSLNCEVASITKVPVNQQIATTPTYATPTYTTPIKTSCFGYSCTTTGGKTYGGQTYGGDVYSYDANKDLRDEVYYQCLRQKQYEIAIATSCINSQIPKNLAVSGSDKVLPLTSNACVAPITKRVGVPIALNTK